MRSPYQQWLCRWYDASLRDAALVDQRRDDTISSLKSVDRILSGTLKLWCLQFGLLHQLM